MDVLERAARIVSLLQLCGGTVEGRKKLQKIVYLLQEAGEDFGQVFSYHYYGVYSSGLAGDIAYMMESGVVTEAQITDGVNVKFSVGLANDAISLVVPAVLQHTPLAEKLSSMTPRELEVLSTIVFLYRNGMRNDELVSRLRELKGSLFDDVLLKKLQEEAKTSFGVSC
jgi:uncharacterized protein